MAEQILWKMKHSQPWTIEIGPLFWLHLRNKGVDFANLLVWGESNMNPSQMDPLLFTLEWMSTKTVTQNHQNPANQFRRSRRGVVKTLTFFSNFSISSPSWVLNFEPTEMKFNLPRDAEFPFANNTFSRGLADSCTKNSNDACRASLFFSMNWFWKGLVRWEFDFLFLKFECKGPYGVITNSTSEMPNQETLFVAKRPMRLQSWQSWKR